MTDINKQMEEEAREYSYSPKRSTGHYTDVQIEQYINDAYVDGANSIIDRFRWRKVSEELPEVKDENYFINIKRYDNEFRIDTICVFAEMEDVKGYLEFNNVDSWKPID